jgi:hypothetical protein
MNPIRRTISFSLLAWPWLAFRVSAHEQHSHRKGMKTEKLGLGTSAAVDAQGRLWIARTETAGNEQPAGQTIVLQMSSDLGKTWSAPKRVLQAPEVIEAEGESRPKLAFGSKGEIYIAYTRQLAKPYTGEIRFVRSLDGGLSFSAPLTVHANRDLITHRFESMIIDTTGRLYIAWIDKRDGEAARARNEKYEGAAVYYAISGDGGASFKGDYKLAEHSCECCRIALALNQEGKPVALWRHVFEPNVRDHALAVLSADGKPSAPVRASFDDWRIDACPHHGPSLAYAPDGTRHQVWFNIKDDEGGVFYATANRSGELTTPVRLGSAQAEHGEVAIRGRNVALVWKQFDGKSTAIVGKLSGDGGRTWHDKELAVTQGNSDHPHLVPTPSGIVLVWRTQNEGIRTLLLKSEI